MKLLPAFSNEKLIFLYKQMLLIRYMEKEIDESVRKGLIYGTTHLCIGQEASAVGVCSVLNENDKITSTHRGHGHSIAHGADLGKMMAELYGKTSGYSKGKGGSMHIADVSGGNLGSNGIVGGGIPIAVGSALTAQMKGLSDVTVCFFGDGATNEGSFHEALNLASIWNLPVVFVCENNQYGMSSPIQDMVNIENLSTRAKSYGFTGVTIDGNDLVAVINAAHIAVEQARNNGGPTLIEAQTYRYKGHSKSDQQLYRTEEEVNMWRKKDPIKRYEHLLLAHHILTEQKINKLKKLALKKVDKAVHFAEASEEPLREDVFKDVYA